MHKVLSMSCVETIYSTNKKLAREDYFKQTRNTHDMNTDISFMNPDKLKPNDINVYCFCRLFICVCNNNKMSS